MTAKQVTFTNQVSLPAIGQGTWYMDEDPSRHRDEVSTLQAGLDLNLRLVDIAETYADGAAEEVVSKALTGRRDSAFLVPEVYPWSAAGRKAVAVCEVNLCQLKTNYLGLYLLHQMDDLSLTGTVDTMETLAAQGKIRRWGVSNLDYDDMQALWQVPNGREYATNQVLYHLTLRDIEYGLPSWCQQQRIPVMVCSLLIQTGRLRDDLLSNSVVNDITHAHNVNAVWILLA